MENSLIFNLETVFGPAVTFDKNIYKGTVEILKNADCKLFVTADEFAFLQEFDEKDLFIYLIEANTEKSVNIPFETKVQDIHGMFLLRGDSQIVIIQDSSEFRSELTPLCAIHYHLPIGDYQLQLLKGYYQIFGYYLNGRQFRQQYDRKYSVIQPILADHRIRSPLPSATSAYEIEPHVKMKIREIYNCLYKHGFSKSYELLSIIEQILIAFGMQARNESPFQSSDIKLASAARELLHAKYALRGRDFFVNEIASELDYTPRHLGSVFGRVFGKPMNVYKDEYTFEKVKDLIQKGYKLKEVSLETHFYSYVHFCVFVKKMAKLTPTQLRKKLLGRDYYT